MDGETTSYVERERQRSEALQQEQLDWLHQQHEELVEQTRLLGEQTALLREVRQHTGFMYNVLVIWVVLTCLGLVVYVMSILG
jgi:hypothetical protein